MAIERNTDLILRAQVGQALQPIAQVVQKVKDLIQVLDQQRAAAASGDTTLNSYAKALRDVEKASGELLRSREALDNFQTRQDTAAAKRQEADTKRQTRDDFASQVASQGTPATADQTRQLARLDAAFNSSEKRATAAEAAYAKAATQLQRLGVLTDDLANAQERLNATHANISNSVQSAAEALRLGQAQNDTLIETLRAAGIEKQVAEQRARDSARFVEDQEREARASQEAADAIRQKGAAAQAAARYSFAPGTPNARAERQAEIEAAFAADDAEKRLQASRASAARAFQEDQERETRAAQEAGDAIRRKGEAAQAAARYSFAPGTSNARAERQAEIEAAFAADDAEKRLQADRASAARAFQVDQSKLRDAVNQVWQAEDAGAEKARTALLAFQATVQTAAAQVAAAQANAASQGRSLLAPVTLPAPTLAAQVRATLATPSSPGTGTADLAALQAEVARVTSAVTTGSGAVRGYADELKALDAVSRGVVAQSQIVDNFQKQRTAALAALAAFRDALVELEQLEAALKTATPENISEVTSAIAAKNRQIGSISAGTGLAAQAREAQEALAIEEQKLNAIGLTAATVGTAYQSLTQVAVDAAKARQAVLEQEKTVLSSDVDAILTRARNISTAPVADPNTARSAVGAVAGASRNQRDIADVQKATEDLDASFGKTKLTAQGFNRVMDDVYAIQRQIASDASLIDAFTAQSAAVAKATAAYEAAQAELARVGAAARSQTATLSELKAAEDRLNAAAADLSKQATVQAQIDAQLVKRRIDTAALTAETDKLVNVSTRLASVQQRANQGSQTIFGLSAYQVENLSFQVNDVITQLSLGQGVLRTFESQAGQILQVFETSITAMQRMVLYGAPVAAVLTLITLSLLRLKDTLDTQREFNRLLASNADGLAYQASSLTQVARQIEAFGVSFDDAKEATKQFMRDGLSIDTMLQFGKTIKNVSDITGKDFADTLKSVSVIASGSFEDISRLDRELNFLSASQYEAAKAAAENGRMDEARSIALNALTVSAQKGRNEGIDPLAQATRDLTTAWHDFLDAIGSTSVLTTLVTGLRNLTSLARDTANALRFVFNPTSTELQNRVTVLFDTLTKTRQKIEELSKVSPGDPALVVLQAQARDLTRLLYEAETARNKLLEAKPNATLGVPAPGAPVNTGSLPGPFSSLPPPDGRQNREIPGDIAAIIAGAAAATQQSVKELEALYRNEAARNADGSFKTSSAGAVGPLQVVPGTFQEMVTKFQGLFDALSKVLNKPIDIKSNEFNILAGALYYREQSQNFGPALGAAAYNMGPGSDAKGTGVRGVLNGSRSAPQETLQYVANFIASLQNSGAAAPGTLPGVQRNPNAGVQTAKVAIDQLDDIAKRTAQIVDDTLRGTERIEADQKRVDEYAKRRNLEVGAKFNGQVPPEVTSALASEVAEFKKKLDNERQRQIDEANNTATQIIKSAQLQVDKADKANPEAARRAVDTQFEAQLSALNLQIAKGATDVLHDSAVAARDKLLALREQARNEASAAADRAVVDDSVKARDTLIGSVETDLKSGTLSLADAFAKIAVIVKTFKPQIDAAINQSNTDLARLPQTPATQQQIAKNSAVDTTGRAAFLAVDQLGLLKVNEIIAARDTKVKELNDDVANGRKTQQEADAEIVKAYNAAREPLNANINALQQQLDLQKELGEITPEAYAKMTASLQKAKSASEDLTASQRKFIQELDGVIVNSAVQGFEAIATSIGGALNGTAKWSDVLKSTLQAFGGFVASVLKGLAEIILKQTLLNALQSSGAAGGIGKLLGFGGQAAGAAAEAGSGGADVAGSAIAAGLYHGGGLVGAVANMRRMVDPNAFVRAPRMHSGGMVGLAADERARVLQVGEEVITKSDWRHQSNNPTQGGTSGAAGSIRNVLVFKDEDIAGAMSSSQGEQVILTHLKRNAATVRALLGVR